MRKLTHTELIHRQLDRQDTPRLPFCVLLNNIRSLYNVGSIFRTADGAGVQKIWLCGITGYPPQSGIRKTALGAEDRVAWEYREDPRSLAGELRQNGYTLVLLEQLKESIPYQEFRPDRPVCLVVGNEVTGVSDHLLSLCDHAIEIEMDGIKNSLNVGVAFGIVSYHIRHHLKNRVQR